MYAKLIRSLTSEAVFKFFDNNTFRVDIKGIPNMLSMKCYSAEYDYIRIYGRIISEHPYIDDTTLPETRLSRLKSDGDREHSR